MLFGTQSLRATAATTLFFFAWMTLHPALAAAVQSAPPPAAPAPAGNALDDLRDAAQRGRDKAGRGEAHDAEDLRLAGAGAGDGLDAEERAAEAGFAEVVGPLADRRLPAAIQQRHAQAVADYRANMAALKGRLRAFRDAHGRRDAAAEQRTRADLADFLEKHQKARPRQPFDPRHLPFRAPDDKARAPRERKEDLDLLIQPAQPVKVAAAELAPGLLAAAEPGAAPAPEDLAETEDAPLTPAIRAQAEALRGNPVEIYHFVRNTVEFLPTYGSIQGADLTLQTRRGNAFDTASLLVALLRAANIPARYVYGTIQVPAEQVMNWVGGVKTPEAAQSLLSQGGVPNTMLVSGGKAVAFRLEHVWVEAFVDYVPSRGAVNRTGDTWVPLDASFKQYAYTDGMDLKANVPFDANGFVERVKQTATLNEAEGWVQNVDQNLVQATMTDYQTRMNAYIDGQKPDATVGDVIGTKTIAPQTYPILMGTLPYRTVAVGSPSASLPDKLRFKLRVSLYASDLDRASDNPDFSYDVSWAALAGKRVSFTYDPASPADQAVIDDANANYQTRLPAYLINVRPTLKVEGGTVKTGGSYTMGENHVLTVRVIAPWYERDRDYRVTAGDFYVLGLNAAGVAPEIFNGRTQQQDLRVTMGPDFQGYTAEMFHQIALGWWAEKYAFNDIVGALNKVVQYQLPSHTLIGSPLTVRYFFGIARSASYGSRVMDAKEDLLMAVHAGGDPEPRRRFALSAGYIGSYLEAGIYEQAFLMEPGHAMSTITALKVASGQGVAIYTIDASNAAMLSRIATAPEDVEAMRDAVAAGLRVTTAQRDITVDNFTGLGYILEDPRTGAAAYLISGGRNGGNAPAGQTIYALPQMPSIQGIGYMLRSALRDAGAKLAVTEKGVIVGIVLPELAGAGGAGVAVGGAAVAAAAILMVVVLALMISTAVAEYVDTNYPRINRRFRHYTNAAFAIAASGMILETQSDGTFGSGVYVTDAFAEERLGIGCPPDSLDVATRLQIPRPDKIDPSRVTGWVEITITRDGYYVIDSQVNSTGQTEFIIRAPLVPMIHPYYKTATRALYIGPYAFALNMSYVCF